MASDIDMCSNALLLIGANTINSFTDPGAGALAANNLYTPTYEDMLTSHPWRFATGKVALSQLTSTPLDEFTYAYQLPADYLMAIKVYPNTLYRIYEDKLYTNVNSVNLEYVFKPAAENSLPAYFVKAMEYKLASEFAMSVTSNKTTAQLYEEKARFQLQKARSLDSIADPNVSIVSSPFIDARNARQG